MRLSFIPCRVPTVTAPAMVDGVVSSEGAIDTAFKAPLLKPRTSAGGHPAEDTSVRGGQPAGSFAGAGGNAKGEVDPSTRTLSAYAVTISRLFSSRISSISPVPRNIHWRNARAAMSKQFYCRVYRAVASHAIKVLGKPSMALYVIAMPRKPLDGFTRYQGAEKTLHDGSTLHATSLVRTKRAALFTIREKAFILRTRESESSQRHIRSIASCTHLIFDTEIRAGSAEYRTCPHSSSTVVVDTHLL